jgi:hypothetical protein
MPTRSRPKRSKVTTRGRSSRAVARQVEIGLSGQRPATGVHEALRMQAVLEWIDARQ